MQIISFTFLMGKFRRSAKFWQRPCLFHILIIWIKNKLTKQTVKILMIRSRLIWISTVCKCMSEFTWCPKLPDFSQNDFIFGWFCHGCSYVCRKWSSLVISFFHDVNTNGWYCFWGLQYRCITVTGAKSPVNVNFYTNGRVYTNGCYNGPDTK